MESEAAETGWIWLKYIGFWSIGIIVLFSAILESLRTFKEIIYCQLFHPWAFSPQSPPNACRHELLLLLASWREKTEVEE